MKPALPQSLIVLIVLVIVTGFTGWWTWSAYQRAERAQRRLATAERSWNGLTLSDPPPTAAVAATLRQRVADLNARLVDVREALGDTRTDPVRLDAAPMLRSEAFFTLAQFVEAQHAQAKQAGVDVPQGYAFGFSAYSNSGPVDEELGIVHRQHLVVKSILEVLWGSGARELTRVQRESADTKVPGSAAHARSVRRDGRPEDYLQLPVGRSVARAGLVDTLAFRIGFVGKTATLRHVLAGLQSLPVPLVVRAVEVEPLDATGRARGGARSLADLFSDDDIDASKAGQGDVVPVIATNDAEFLVLVEYLNFHHVSGIEADVEEVTR